MAAHQEEASEFHDFQVPSPSHHPRGPQELQLLGQQPLQPGPGKRHGLQEVQRLERAAAAHRGPFRTPGQAGKVRGTGGTQQGQGRLPGL